MRHGFIKAAAVTPNLKVADPVYNAERICEKLKEAYERKAKIIVFPELCITGYTCQDLFLQEILLKEALAALKRITECTKGQDALVFVGLPVVRHQKLYNAAAVLRDGKILGMVPILYSELRGILRGKAFYARERGGGGYSDRQREDSVRIKAALCL